MSAEAKKPSLEPRNDIDPFEIGQVTEQIPAWELWEDGIEPAEDMPARAEDKAA
jgi:hypothetical protein